MEGGKTALPDYVLAGIGTRFLCRMFDGFALQLISMLVMILVFIPSTFVFGESALDGFVGDLENISDFYLVFPYLLAFTVIDYCSGVSVLKWVFGLRVISLDGGSISFKSSLKRNLLLLIDGFLLGLVAFQAMRKSALRQRIGDRSAGTIVINYR